MAGSISTTEVIERGGSLLQGSLVHRSEIPYVPRPVWESGAVHSATQSQPRAAENHYEQLEICLGHQSIGPKLGEKPTQSCVVFTTTH